MKKRIWSGLAAFCEPLGCFALTGLQVFGVSVIVLTIAVIRTFWPLSENDVLEIVERNRELFILFKYGMMAIAATFFTFFSIAVLVVLAQHLLESGSPSSYLDGSYQSEEDNPDSAHRSPYR